ncbi:MAG TPA: hypothetical protein ENI61_00065, partial [Ignavibacteria bacterium]|nr:hypothetical protein [Ignavibacteria bacterium]
MADISIREIILTLIKDKIGMDPLWNKVEQKLIILCSELNEPINKEKKIDFLSKLNEIRLFLLKNEFGVEKLEFIKEEIKRYKETKIISLYEEKEDTITKDIINNYARLGKGTEGIVGIHQDFNYTQLSKLTNGVYKKTGLIKFYISRERVVQGQIIAEAYDYLQRIPIATLIESKKIDKGTGEPLHKYISLFGNKVNTTMFNKVKEIDMQFYVYRFISEESEDMILLSTKKCHTGDCKIIGVTVNCNDYKVLTDSTRLPTKLPFFFAQDVFERIVKFKNHDEFFDKVKSLKINKNNFFDYPFTINVKNKTWKLIQPKWYKWFIWSWLTHEKKGLFNQYPMHILQLGPKNSGKSVTLNSLHSRSKERRKIFTGTGSTLKYLVPSFKYKPASIGYLAESNRFSFCDEFSRCLINTRTTKAGSDREESVGIMNDLLEHQRREFGSGVSKANVNMTSRTIAMSNPIRGIQNSEDLVRLMDESWLSR